MKKRRALALLLGSTLFMMACTQHSSEKKSETESVQAQLPPAERGKALVAAKGCLTCHSIDGSRMTGPSYKGIFGTDVKLADGSTVKVDEGYIRESIQTPMAKIVAGYPPTMPAYQGIVSDQEITAITEYIKSLK